MSKVTSKYQVSIPKALAEKIGLRVGDELTWEDAAGTLRGRVAAAQARVSPRGRLQLYYAASARQAARERARRLPRSRRRGWNREDLYTR